MNNVNEQDIEITKFFGTVPRGHSKSSYMEALVEHYANQTATTVGFKRLTDTAVLPTKAHPSDSGFDLFADETVIIEPGETVVVKTGIAVKLPEGYEATVRPRSGITSRTKLRVQYGTIDCGYIGDIGIIVDNIAQETGAYCDGILETVSGVVQVQSEEYRKYADDSYLIRKGDKLAQLVVSPVATFAGVEVFDIDETDRGSNGFGSTGVTT